MEHKQTWRSVGGNVSADTPSTFWLRPKERRRFPRTRPLQLDDSRVCFTHARTHTHKIHTCMQAFKHTYNMHAYRYDEEGRVRIIGAASSDASPFTDRWQWQYFSVRQPDLHACVRWKLVINTNCGEECTQLGQIRLYKQGPTEGANVGLS